MEQPKENDSNSQIGKIAQITQNPLFILLLVIVAFLISFVSLLPIRVQQMGTSVFYIFQVTPIAYWVGLSTIVCALFFMIPHLRERRFQIVFVFSSITLMACFRMVFPIIFTSVPAYAPDAASYMSIVSSWVRFGVNFSVDGAYQHDFPLSFLVAYVFVKLGVPIDAFYRIAPFFVYALDSIFLYLIVDEVIPKNKKYSILPALSVFLFSFSSLNYWVTLHWSPDLFGSFMFFVCLYLGIRFAEGGKWSVKAMLPVFVCLFLLILSHHLSTLYLIVTFLGLSVSVWFFKPARFKIGALAFFIMAIFTYTAWFAYGSYYYPKFFSIYVYISGSGGVVQQSGVAGLLPNLTFVIFPAFIVVLFIIEFFKMLQIKNPLPLILHLRGKLREIRVRESNNSLLVFAVGFVFILVLFIFGIGIPNLFGLRIFEVLCIGLYPIAGITLFKLADSNSSKKKFLLLIILLFVIIIDAYRYYNTIQRIVILG